MTRTVTEILIDIRKHYRDGLPIELADALGDPIEASAWILDNTHNDDDELGLWVLSGIDKLTGMAAYDLLDQEGELADRKRALGIEDAYGIAERGPSVLIRTRPADQAGATTPTGKED